MGPVGYYVHHHGVGHLARFRAIDAASAVDLVAISELPIAAGVRLPSDVPWMEAVDPTAGGALHWAPLASCTATPRLKVLVDWLDAVRPSAMVIDVSVEAAIACRLAGVPTVVVRQLGDRTDVAHRLAYASARRLLAPYPAAFESSTDAEVLAKTDHVGFIAPLPAAAEVAAAVGDPAVDVGADDAVVLWGAGGGQLGGGAVDAIAANVDGTVYCAGRQIWPDADPPTAANVVALGWVASPGSLLTARPLVVGSAGNNAVALVAAARCPFVAVPQPRPFDEQSHLADGLVAAGVAARGPDRPDEAAWGEAMATARRRADRWSVLSGGAGGAARAASVIERAMDR